MIVPRQAAIGLALLVAMLTITTAYTAAVARAPAGFIARDGELVIGPADGSPLGQGVVGVGLARALRGIAGVEAVSPEIYAPTVVEGRSLFVRGVEWDAIPQVEMGFERTGGTEPAGLHDALVGEGLLESGIALGDVLLLPMTYTRGAVDVTVVGTFRSAGLLADELLVGLDLARALANLTADDVHALRVRSSAPEALRDIVQSPVAKFTYSEVVVSSSEVISGETLVVRGKLTNWGSLAGVKEVVVRADGEPVARLEVHVLPRSTKPFEIPLRLAGAGTVDVSVNPTFAVEVRASEGRFELPDVLVRGRGVPGRLVDANGAPIPGAIILGPADRTHTDAGGGFIWTPSAQGALELRAAGSGGALAIHHAYVVEEENERRAEFRIRGVAVPEALVSSLGPTFVQVRAENVGGQPGRLSIVPSVDGHEIEPVDLGEFAVGEVRVVPVGVGILAEGFHNVRIDGAPLLRLEAVAIADPRVESALRTAERGPGPVADPLVRGEEEVERVVGRIRMGVWAVAAATAVLAVAGGSAVLARHVNERARAIGLLRAIGMGPEAIGERAMREASLVSAAAIAGGLPLGIALALLLSAGWEVRAFGHTLRPVFSPVALGVQALAVHLGIVVIARYLVGRMLRPPVQALLVR